MLKEVIKTAVNPHHSNRDTENLLYSSKAYTGFLLEQIDKYADTVKELAPIRKSLNSKRKILDRLELTIEQYLKQYSDNPYNKEAILTLKLSMDEVSLKIRNQCTYADNIKSEIPKIQNGLQYIQIIHNETPFLDSADLEKIKKLGDILKFIDENKIFVFHGIESWPKELSKKELRAAFSDYDSLINKALKFIKSPTIEVSTFEEVPLAPASNQELRQQALLELNIPDSIKSDPRINHISVKHLSKRIRNILKVLNDDSSEFESACTIDSNILLDQNCYSSFIRRMKLINFISTDLKGNKDSYLASSIRGLCLSSLLTSSDKQFFELCRVIRINIEADKQKNGFVTVDDNFKDRIFPKPAHPLAEQFQKNNPNLGEITKFLQGKDQFKSRSATDWKDNEITTWAMRQAILLKLSSGKYTDTPKEDWIKTNFNEDIVSKFARQLKNELDNLISDGLIVEKIPGKSKTGIALAKR